MNSSATPSTDEVALALLRVELESTPMTAYWWHETEQLHARLRRERYQREMAVRAAEAMAGRLAALQAKVAARPEKARFRHGLFMLATVGAFGVGLMARC